MLAAAMPELGVVAIMSYSWDRFMIDPAPGPRVRADFDGLIDRGGVAEIPGTAALLIGQSTLPRLADSIRQPLLLLDAAEGAAGLAEQMCCAAAVFDASELIVIDVGGDILGEGHEPGLRTPLADSLSLAAAVQSGIPVRAFVAGPGLDGELSPAEVHSRLDRLEARQAAVLRPRDALPFNSIWSWHPSEANALLSAAAAGWRGTVQTQRNSAVTLTDNAANIYEVSARRLVDSSLASVLLGATSFEQAERLLRDRRNGRSELDIERTRSGDRAQARTPSLETLDFVDEYVIHAAAEGINALTIRRVAELVSATDPAATEALRELLAHHRPDNFRPPLYTVDSAS